MVLSITKMLICLYAQKATWPFVKVKQAKRIVILSKEQHIILTLRSASYALIAVFVIKMNIKAPAKTQALMPGTGKGGDFGEMILAPNQTYRITGVRFTGKQGRSGANYIFSVNPAHNVGTSGFPYRLGQCSVIEGLWHKLSLLPFGFPIFL